MMDVNTKFKSSVFSALFNNPNLLRELYCAIEGVSLPDNVPVTINTLQDALFMGVLNDISFEIGDKLVVLIEHQSTINPNMALRLLIYIARVYEKTIKSRKIYSTKLLAIPRPEFFVLYNGIAPYPAEAILKLSDAFESTESLGVAQPESPSLELTVKVLNINPGMNQGIAQKCKALAEYSAFVAKTREFEQASGDRKEAVRKAVLYCCDHDILKEFLEQNATEVMNMLLTEWNWDDALAVRYEEGMERGLARGLERGLEKGLERGLEKAARNALAKGMPLDMIYDITGLDADTIKNIQMDL